MTDNDKTMEAIARVAGAIAHDLNNLITSMRGLSALALQELPPDHPIRPDLEEIGNASQRAAELTRDLLSFARRGNSAPRAIDLNSIVEQAVAAVREEVRGATQVRFDPGANVPPVHADPAQVAAIANNLLLAARAAVRDGGIIDVATDLGEPGFATLSVRDSGTTIPAEHLDRAFEPFHRRPTGESAGVALAVAYMIARQSAGHADVQSGPGGTSIRVFLPLAGSER